MSNIFFTDGIMLYDTYIKQIIISNGKTEIAKQKTSHRTTSFRLYKENSLYSFSEYDFN